MNHSTPTGQEERLIVDLLPVKAEEVLQVVAPGGAADVKAEWVEEDGRRTGRHRRQVSEPPEKARLQRVPLGAPVQGQEPGRELFHARARRRVGIGGRWGILASTAATAAPSANQIHEARVRVAAIAAEKAAAVDTSAADVLLLQRGIPDRVGIVVDRFLLLEFFSGLFLRRRHPRDGRGRGQQGQQFIEK